MLFLIPLLASAAASYAASKSQADAQKGLSDKERQLREEAVGRAQSLFSSQHPELMKSFGAAPRGMEQYGQDVQTQNKKSLQDTAQTLAQSLSDAGITGGAAGQHLMRGIGEQTGQGFKDYANVVGQEAGLRYGDKREYLNAIQNMAQKRITQ